MTSKVKIEGLRELDKALGELPKATGKNVLRRVLKKRAAPVAAAMAARAPRQYGDLAASVDHGSRLSAKQRSKHRKLKSSTAVEWFIGPSTEGHKAALAHAHLMEFGAYNDPPQPYARPAWEANKAQVLDGIKDDLWTEISKSAARLARKRAKQAAG